MTYTRRYLVASLFFIGALSSSLAAPEPSPASSGSPFEPIAFLVGGVWRGELIGEKGVRTSIELRCDWNANHQGIRFDGTFVTDGKRSPYTSGIYNWNPGKRQLVFVYSDAAGNLTEGAVRLENGAVVHDFSTTDAAGKIEKARAIITPHGVDAYTNEIWIEKEGAMQKLVSVNYQRQAN